MNLHGKLIKFLRETNSPECLIELWQGDPSVANANKGPGTACFPDANVFTRGRPLANPLIGNIRYPDGYSPPDFAKALLSDRE